MKQGLFFTLSLFFAAVSWAQTSYKLHVNFSKDPKDFLQKNIYYNRQFADSLSLHREVQSVLLRCAEYSYLTATARIQNSGDSVIADIEPGDSYKWLELKKGNLSDELLEDAGFRFRNFRQSQFSPALFYAAVQKLLQVLENSGYPFASVSLDSVKADSQGVSASLNLQKGPLIVFDTIKVIGDARMSHRFLQHYTGIYPTAIYSEKLFSALAPRLSELSYVSNVRRPVIYFYGNKARPVLYLNHRKASYADGVLGIAPNSSLNNKLVVTGDVNLSLQNILGSGKSAELTYRSFLNSSQEFKARFNYPYFLGTKVSLEYAFNLLKYDTAFLDVKNELALQYRFIGSNYIKVFYSLQQTSLITVDTNAIALSRQLPTANDLRSDFYGLGVKLTQLDYFLNPSKGFTIETDAALGTKQILRNQTINAMRIRDGLNAYNIYDSLKLDFLQVRFNLLASAFLPIAGNFVLHTQLRASWFHSEKLFVNELFRIGGLKTLRGFDEQSIFANKFLIANFEMRYLLTQNSNALLFWNGAWYNNEVSGIARIDNPWGIGAGVNLETGAGILSLFYALGKELGNPIEYQKGKIHFGYVNYF